MIGFAYADLGEDFFIVGMLVLGPLFATLAAVIGTQVPGNAISWLMLTVGCSVPFSTVVSLFVPTSAPDAATFWLAVGVFFTEISWIFFIFPVLLILFLFPSGRFFSRRWRWGGWLTALMVGTMLFVALFSETLTSSLYGWSIDTPFGFIPDSFFDGWFGFVWTGLLAVLALGGLAALVVRYRHSPLEERTQLKWVVFTAAAFAFFYAGSAIGSDAFTDMNLFSIGFAITFGLIPISMTVAITKYRLYEIDRIISRTVLYALVIGLMAAVYLVAVLALGLILPTEGDLQVALATLVAAAVSVPAARQLRRWLDRRFFRSRYDAGRVISDFALHLQHDIDLSSIIDGTGQAVDSTFQPERSVVWLAEDPS